MKRSKKGTWIIENPKVKYIVYIEKALITEIWGYSYGFNKVSLRVKKALSPKKDSYIEITYPDYHVKKIVSDNREDLMVYILKHHRYRGNNDNVYIEERLNSYRNHLIEYFPEKII